MQTQLFPDYQIARQSDFLCFASKAINIIMPGYMVIKLSYKSPTDSGTLLIDRVQKRIRYILDTL